MPEMIGDLAASGCSGCISVAKGRDISHLALIFFDFSAGDKGGGFARSCNAPKEAARDRSLAARSGHHFAMPDRHRIALQWPSSRIVCALPLEILLMRKWFFAAGLAAFLAPAVALPQSPTSPQPPAKADPAKPEAAKPEAAKPDKSSVYEQLNLFSEAFERIRQDAVEPVADQKLIETAIAGMLSGLDPNSVYML